MRPRSPRSCERSSRAWSICTLRRRSTGISKVADRLRVLLLEDAGFSWLNGIRERTQISRSALMVLTSTYGFIHYIVCISSGELRWTLRRFAKRLLTVVPALFNKLVMQINGIDGSVWRCGVASHSVLSELDCVKPPVCPPLRSCQRAAVRAGRGEAGRFRCGGAAHGHSDQTQHLCWHALLDGPRGHQTVGLWL